MDIIIGLIPALGWGFMPLAATKMGGRPVNQIVGTTVGAFVGALAVYLDLRPAISPGAALLSALSGALWAVGQMGQYHAFTRIGVARTMPVSTGLQLVGTSLVGVFVFGEWPTVQGRLIGFAGLALVVLGVWLTSLHKKSGEKGSVDKAVLLLLFFTNFGYLAYSAIPDVVGAKGVAIFFPQAAGMACAALVYAVASGQGAALKEASSWRNMLTGLLFSVAALSYIFSAQRNGIATGFVLAQLSVVIATISGIVLLKETKTPFELKATLAGLALIALGGVATVFA